jgi:predicted RNA binding protein YcfA (HicA-like mRNA interferase family)
VPRLRTLSGREVRSILEKHGFVLTRQRGSHMMMEKIVEGGTLLVPVPNHKTVATGTLQNIIRLCGLGRGPFEA